MELSRRSFLKRSAVLASALAAPSLAGAAEGGFGFKRTGTSIALVRGDRVIWQLNCPRNGVKPWFHPVALPDGPVLTWERPPDHPWHRGLWFSWNDLNAINYWGEDATTGLSPGRTEVADVTAETGKDDSAKIEMTILYRPPGKPPVLTEKRSLAVSAPETGGLYRIDWRAAFAAGPEDVHLKGGTAGGGYAGLSARIAKGTKDWKLIGSEGSTDTPAEMLPGSLARNSHGKRARWMDFTFADAATGREAGIALLEAPDSFRHPSQWHNIIDEKAPFGYFSPAPLWSEPYDLPAGKELRVRYRIIAHPGRLAPEFLQKEWKSLG